MNRTEHRQKFTTEALRYGVPEHTADSLARFVVDGLRSWQRGLAHRVLEE